VDRLGVRIAFLATVVFAFVVVAGGRSPAAPAEHVLYQFTGGSDGGGPMGRLALNTSSGNLFGTTHFGGITTCGGNFGGGCGVVFALSLAGSTWTQTPLYAVADGSDGGFPNGGVVLDGAGNLYGTASAGGSNACSIGCGVVYELVQSSGAWTERILHTFTGSDGQFPNASLFNGGGALYSTTWYGGTHGAGTVFRLSPTGSGGWIESLLYSFNGTQDGTSPAGGVVLDTSGNVYGTTYPFNGYNDGVAFELKPKSNVPWKQRVIDSFGTGSGGEDPYAGLIIDGAGNLYGTTIEGGGTGNGVVFELVRRGRHFKERVLHTFTGSPDGSSPYAGLTADGAGNLYGATLFGGAHNYGTVFELALKPRGGYKERILYSFTGGNDGANPKAEPILDTSGNLYGTTEGGGQFGQGVAYEIIP
jgi:uncharacterized repeat protein (TIGR03803 family)